MHFKIVWNAQNTSDCSKPALKNGCNGTQYYHLAVYAKRLLKHFTATLITERSHMSIRITSPDVIIAQ